MWPAVLCGANFILHSAGWLEGGLSMGYEKFVMDAEHCGAFHVFANGMPVDDNALALDAFHEVGPGKHFLGSAHTMRNYETAFYDFPTCRTTTPSSSGATRAPRTSSSAPTPSGRSMLREFEAPAMDEGTREALDDFVARRKAAMPDAWY